MKVTVYGSHLCPDTLYAINQLMSKGVDMSFQNIPTALPDLKKFPAIRENDAIFDNAKKNGGRVICVGTTSCRTVESATGEDGILKAGSGWTDIFIYPGYRFKILDGLITNFHLPESTLVMLVSALAGRDHVLHAYEEAIKERYRFFSFGDATLIIDNIHDHR